MTDHPIGHFYRLAKERPRGQRPPPTTYWHAEPPCSFIQRGAYAIGSVPVTIDPDDPRVVACSCFDVAGIVGINVKSRHRRPGAGRKP